MSRSNGRIPDLLDPIAVTFHAKLRLGERFGPHPDQEARARGEIRAAILDGRVATSPPLGLRGTGAHTWYAWTRDARRVYVLRCRRRPLVVVTVLDPDEGTVESGPPPRPGFRSAA